MCFTDDERYKEEWENSDDCMSTGISLEDYSYSREIDDYGTDDYDTDD